MKRFAEDTKEYSKESEWWQGIPLVREHAKMPKLMKNKTIEKFLTSEERKALKNKEKRRKKEKRKNKIRKVNGSSPYGMFLTFFKSILFIFGSPTTLQKHNADINLLRRERLAREHREQIRVKTFLIKSEKKEEESNVEKIQLNEDRDRRYNSQFNPEFSQR